MSSEDSGGWDFSAAAATPAGGLGTIPPVPPPTNVGTPGSGPGDPGRPGVGNRVGNLVRTFVRGVGQTLITLGLVLLLFVVYEVWVSNIFAHQRQNKVRQQFSQAVQKGQDPLKGQDRLNLPSGKQIVIPAGEGFANLYIPRFGKDFAWTVVQGTAAGDLERGPGHYTDTAVPGQLGNFALAGHRVGKGEPFLNLDQLVPGDSVVVQTAGNWYVYKILGDAKKYAAASKLTSKSQRAAAIVDALNSRDSQGVPGREIVTPDDVAVIAPVPDNSGLTPTRALLTMTTCHPKYSADQRMILHAALARAVPAKGNAIPKELPGGTL
ncbi:MAG: class sortase [Frankiales bacterium]|nr:class sortase [Frankiales bacterium]